MYKKTNSTDDKNITPTYASRSLQNPVPKYQLPQQGMASQNAYQLIHDELALDGNAHMNLATFVTTWMEDEATRLMTETLEKNIVDKDEYPQTAEIENRCVNIIAKLWNAPDGANTIGTSTIGSSEACMLAGMALKFRWRKRQQAAGKPVDKPNLVLGINAQVCWEKFCRYWDIEPRFVHVEPGRYHLDPATALSLCDENTIGVVAILGSTFDGSFEPVQELSRLLDQYEVEHGISIPIHVDAASGGFVAPFSKPELIWDFRLPRVSSINTSSHKYGMVYPGLGWVIWQRVEDLPEELIFNVDYLGGSMPTFSINFSRPGNGVVAQYYNFLRLGFDGYQQIIQNCQNIAHHIAKGLGEIGPFAILTDGSDLPVVAFTLKDSSAIPYTLFDLSDRLRERGWQVPAYPMPANLTELVIMRIVVKENFSLDMADLLLEDIKRYVQILGNGHPTEKTPRPSFHH